VNNNQDNNFMVINNITNHQDTINLTITSCSIDDKKFIPKLFLYTSDFILFLNQFYAISGRNSWSF